MRFIYKINAKDPVWLKKLNIGEPVGLWLKSGEAKPAKLGQKRLSSQVRPEGPFQPS